MYALLNTQEGGNYGIVMSRHKTPEAAEAARQRSEHAIGRRHKNALTYLMRTTREIDADIRIGQRILL